MNPGSMVFELQGSVGELKQSNVNLTHVVERGFARIEALERSTGEVKEVLRALAPKLDDLAGFTRHRAPHLVDKADLVKLQGELTAEIEKRPTRRQSLLDVILIVGLIGTRLTIGSHMAR